jgi:hypothetical protein
MYRDSALQVMYDITGPHIEGLGLGYSDLPIRGFLSSACVLASIDLLVYGF